MKRYKYIVSFVLLAIILQPIQAITNSELRERVYLQTDKELYLSGELLWMKLYLTDAEGKPTSFSKIGYVELLDETTAQVQVKLEINNGIGEGWMELPATLPTGYYRMVAYTRYMQNEGESIYFNKPIAIINTFRTDQTIKIDTTINAPTPSVLENSLSVTTEKQAYTTRSSGNVHIQGLPDNIHSLAVSVTGKDIIYPANGINISRWEKQLSLLPQSTIQTKLLPEYEGHILTGKIVDVENNESSIRERVSPLLGFVGNQVRLFGGQQNNLNNNNDVYFYTKRISGMHEIATATYSPSNKKYRIDIQTPFSTHSETKMQEFIMNPAWKDELTQRSVGLQVLHTYTADSLSQIDSLLAHFEWKPDRSYILDEYTRFTTMEEVVIEFIPSLRWRRINNTRLLSVLNEERTGFSIGNSLILLDGVPITDHESIFRYDPLLVYKIDVYTGKYVFGSQFFDGIIFFTTYNKDYPTLKVDESTQFFDYEGTQPRRHFYAPDYSNETNRNKRIPDYRHTLLWAPEIQTENKSSLDIPFSTSDLTGEFQVTVEGITKDGKVLRGMYIFEVN